MADGVGKHKWPSRPWSYIEDTCSACTREGRKEYQLIGPGEGYHATFCEEEDAKLASKAPELAEALRACAEELRFLKSVSATVGRAEKLLAELA